MKKFLIISITIFFSFEVVGQSQVILRDSTVINIAVKSFFGRTLTFYTFVPDLNSSKIDIDEVIGLNGETPNYRKDAILKKNPSIKFNNERVDKMPTTTEPGVVKLYKSTITHEMDGGKYIRNAGYYYLAGTGIAVTGLMVTSFSDDKDVIKVGAVVSICGFVSSIIGHTQLVKGGNLLREKPIELGLAENGIGVAIKF